MKISIHLFLLLCLLAFLSVACGSSPASTITPPQPTATATQAVTAQHILSTPVTYVALGASDAVGVGTNEPGSQGYVPLLAAHLQKGSHLLNLGVSGIRLHEALTQELPLALNTSPTLITIWLVANDFVGGVQYDAYMKDLNSLLQQLRAGTKARIVMANLPDLTLLPAFSGQSATQKAKTVLKFDAGMWLSRQLQPVIRSRLSICSVTRVSLQRILNISVVMASTPVLLAMSSFQTTSGML